MKFHEYATFIILGTLTLELFASLYFQDWGRVGLAFTALGGWAYVAVYEKGEREERRRIDREFEPYGG